MANKYNNLNDLFTAVANAIRAKKNSNETIVADTFPDEIRNLRAGFDYNNQKTTSIADYEFANCTDLLSVDCCDLTSVGIGAFENCTNLKSVVLYDNVASVGENAFKGCNCTIYCMFESQPETWHENWNPDGCEVVWTLVETWDISATEEDNVTVKLYNDVSNEGKYALVIDGTGDMKNYTSGGAPWYGYRDSLTSAIIGNGVTSIGNYAFYWCDSLTSVVIPDSVTTIGDNAFCNCTSLTSVVIPDSVTSIGKGAFGGCYSLTSITIPNSVTSIGGYALSGCSRLTSITIPDSVTSIGLEMFRGCSRLTSITIPDSVTSIGAQAFHSCSKLTSLAIPDSVTSIGNNAFRECSNLASITIPDSVTSIGYEAFGNTAYYNNESNWSDNVLYIGNHLVKAKETILGDYVIREGTVTIGGSAFRDCSSLESVIIPNNVASIGESAFSGCSSLESIEIPDSTISIGHYAFSNCFSLTYIAYLGTISQWNAITLGIYWDTGTGNYAIHCTDGTITKDGVITYG